MFSFLRNFNLPSKVAVPFCILTSNEWEFLLLHIIVVLIYIWALIFNVKKFLPFHSCWCFNFSEGRKQQISFIQTLFKIKFCHFMFCQNRNSLMPSDLKGIQNISRKKKRKRMKWKIKIPTIKTTTMNRYFSIQIHIYSTVHTLYAT